MSMLDGTTFFWPSEPGHKYYKHHRAPEIVEAPFEKRVLKILLAIFLPLWPGFLFCNRLFQLVVNAIAMTK